VRSGVRLYKGTRFIVTGSSSNPKRVARPQGTTTAPAVHLIAGITAAARRPPATLR
jgi:hypothetical protein